MERLHRCRRGGMVPASGLGDVCHTGLVMRDRRFVIVALAVVVWAIVTPPMWRDLRARTPDQLRGPKWLWWVASLNLTGSAGYWLFARKKAD
jgi:hypothetical protein